MRLALDFAMMLAGIVAGRTAMSGGESTLATEELAEEVWRSRGLRGLVGELVDCARALIPRVVLAYVAAVLTVRLVLPLLLVYGRGFPLPELGLAYLSTSVASPGAA